MILAVFMMLLAPLGQARRVDSVTVPNHLTLGHARLVLNGAGVRYYAIFFSVYVGALYLEHPTHQAAVALSESGPSRVAMYFLRGVTASQLRSAWREGFRRNNALAIRKQLGPEIQSFIHLWHPLKDHTQVFLDYLPKQGPRVSVTRVSINGHLAGIFPGSAFHEALLRIWLGPHPPTHALKRRMLGH
ncbi:lipoprotein transmembrane [mine drainage metagenome]|uniref:Lipoprotein transmembrane n=2 Tax=mine drainage metagenome TaxID=410659 RepID=T1BQI8_9ZZZZ